MGKVEHANIMKDSAVSQILNIIFCRRELKFIDATKTKGERAIDHYCVSCTGTFSSHIKEAWKLLTDIFWPRTLSISKQFFYNFWAVTEAQCSEHQQQQTIIP